MDGGGLGIDRSTNLKKDDSEYDAYRKRMMLAYKFRPNPLVSVTRTTNYGWVPTVASISREGRRQGG